MNTLVVKVGGAVAADAIGELEALLEQGYAVCVVHGAGPQITLEMERAGIPVEFVDGRRVTSEKAIEVVRSALADVNAALCRAIGDRALPLRGEEIGLVAERVPGLGLVGDPIPCAPEPVLSALAAGLVPVVSPLAAGPLNVNADEAAAALAVGLGAERLLFLTDVAGLILDGRVVDEIGIDHAARLLENGSLQGGIVPKLGAALTAVRGGVAASIGRTGVAA
jgi:acetylglutamate kinase